MTTSTARNTRDQSTERATGRRKAAARSRKSSGPRGNGEFVLPRIELVPTAHSSLGDEAIELAASAGLKLDPWEAFVLDHALGQRKDGSWAAFEVGVEVPRQNGKGAILEARELAGLFLIREKLIVHSAHQFDTSLEAFRRLMWLIEDTPELDQQVKRVSRSHGEEGIELRTGERIRFRTRTKGGGRGFSADCLMLDEAMILPEYGYGALLPTLSAKPNPQVWYAGSAVDQEVHEDGIVFTRVRERAKEGSPRLAYFGWSLDARRDDGEEALPADLDEEVLTDPESWAQANPALDIRISREHIANEQRAMDPRTFAVERLGVGDWPDTEATQHVIDLKVWEALRDYDSQSLDPVCFAFDAAPDRSMASIAVAGRREDDLLHVEVVERMPGTKWVAPRIAQLVAKHESLAVICEGRGPAASLLPELERLEVEVETIEAGEMARACGHFFDTVDQRDLRHLGTSEMTSALKGAVQRPLGDAWVWSRKNSSYDISPLVAMTVGLWGVSREQAAEPLVALV